MEKKTKILFRANGNQKIGLGHVYRCLAIAEFLEDDFEIEFITGKECQNIKKIIPWDFDLRILLEFDSIEEEAMYLAKQYVRQDIIFVVDGYEFTSEYLKIFKDRGIPLVYIDDKHEIKIYADLIINHAAGFSRMDFNTNLLANICIGPKYAILRKPFLESKREMSFKYDVLICFGGADPSNYTTKILNDIPARLNVAVLVGRAYQYMDELKSEILGRESTHFFSGLTSQELADLMEKSARAIMSSSSVAYEYLTASAGQLYIIQTVDNQAYLFKYLIDEGAALEYKGYFDEGFQSKNINDGRSPERILKAFKNLEAEQFCTIRRVQEIDLMTVFEWVNDVLVREQSYSQEEISLENHKEWFNNKMKDPDCFYYVLEYNNELIGQIRFDIQNKEAFIGYLVSPMKRGLGWGYSVLKLGIKQLLKEELEINVLKGYVKEGNVASGKAFTKCNFQKEATNDYPNSVIYTLKI